MLFIDQYGVPREVADVFEMSYPVECKWCNEIHDAAKVTITQRYLDCSMWKCPNCKVTIDDRPEPLGSAIPVRGNNGLHD